MLQGRCIPTMADLEAQAIVTAIAAYTPTENAPVQVIWDVVVSSDNHNITITSLVSEPVAKLITSGPVLFTIGLVVSIVQLPAIIHAWNAPHRRLE